MTNTISLCDWDANLPETAKRIADTGLFQRVVLCVEDRHILYRQENVREAIDTLRSHGLLVRATPWGVQGFAGESVGAPNGIIDWLKLIGTTNVNDIMFDEPKNATMESLQVLDEMAITLAPNHRFHLAIEPENFDPENHPHMFDSVSISTYLFENSMNDATEARIAADVLRWHDSSVKHTKSAWVQTWGIPEGQEWVPAELIKRWKRLGVDINVWAWDAFRTVSSKRAANPDLVWKNTLRALES